VWLKENLLSTILFKPLKWKTKSAVLSGLQSIVIEEAIRAFPLKSYVRLYNEISEGTDLSSVGFLLEI
jgi:hypothetical protein